MINKETRSFAIDNLKIELRAESDSAMIIGHAAVFNTLSGDLGGFREKIAPGAFTDSIGEDDVRALFNHNPDFVLGRNRSGTLRMSEDDQGLKIEIDPPDTQAARDLMVSLERGDISQMSFGFRVMPDGEKWGEDENGNLVRTLTNVRLFDVSPVTYPAYVDTDVALRSMDQWKQDQIPDDIYLTEIRKKEIELLEATAPA